MATVATPVFPQAINVGITTIINATAQTYQTVFTAGANGSKIESIIASSTDTSNRDITVNLTRSATNYQLAQIQIPLTAGTVNSVPGVNILKGGVTPGGFPGLAIDANGNPYLYLKSGDTLTVNAPVTVTSGKTITVLASGGDF